VPDRKNEALVPGFVPQLPQPHLVAVVDEDRGRTSQDVVRVGGVDREVVGGLLGVVRADGTDLDAPVKAAAA